MQYTEIENIRPTLPLAWHDLSRALPILASSRGVIRVDGSNGVTEAEALGPNRWQIIPPAPEKPFESRNDQVVAYLQKIPNIGRIYYKPNWSSSTITLLWDRRRPSSMTPTYVPPQPSRPAITKLTPQPSRPAAPTYTPTSTSMRTFTPSKPAYAPSKPAAYAPSRPTTPRQESFYAPPERVSTSYRSLLPPGIEPAAYASVRESYREEPREEPRTRQTPGYQWALERAATQRQTLAQASAQGRYPPTTQSYQPVTAGRSTYSPRPSTYSPRPSTYSSTTSGLTGKGSWGRVQLPHVTRPGERADEA